MASAPLQAAREPKASRAPRSTAPTPLPPPARGNAGPADRPLGRVLSAAQFWALMERWRVPDAAALALLGAPVRMGASGKRPRFRFSTHQNRITAYLPELDSVLVASGETPTWLHRNNRAAPFKGRKPIDLMVRDGTDGIAAVLRFLNRAALRASVVTNDK